MPLSDDLNGWLGDHHTSDDRLLPSLPSASTDTGNRIALPMDATFGLKPCCSACFQNVVKSGGSTTPVTISHFAALERGDLRGEIVGQVLVAAGIDEFVAGLVEHRREPDAACRPRRCRRRRSETARRRICWSATWLHMLVKTAMTSSRPQKK